MTRHLDDREMSAALASEALDDVSRDHLRSCIHCRRRLDDFRSVVAERRSRLLDEAPDWQRQKTAIMARLVSAPGGAGIRRRRHWIRPLLVAAAMVLVAVGAGLIDVSRDTAVVPTPRPDLPIEDILARTEALLDDDTIFGFDVLDEVSDEEVEVLLGNQSS